MSTAVGQGGSEDRGRGKHLGELVKVFRHRGGSWRDMGNFLKSIFEEPGPQVLGQVSRVVCRHNAGGRHYATLSAAAANASDYPMFDHPRYARPCISVGAFDSKKNPGVVVHDLCAKARDYLLSIGKGDPEGHAGRDFDFEPAVSSPPTHPGESQATESQGSVNVSNIVEGRLRSDDVPEVIEISDSEDGGIEEDLLINDGDIPADVVGEISEAMSSEVDIPDSGPSTHSVLQDSRSTSTKMRVATLGYLWGFSDHQQALRAEFHRLCAEPELFVLHLCGCGLCVTRDGVKVYGCVEFSHLRLGSHVENGTHRTFHRAIELSSEENYADLCRIFHEGCQGQDRHGEGIF